MVKKHQGKTHERCLSTKIQGNDKPFLLFINDLLNISNVLNFCLFADDTDIYYESNPLQELEKTVLKSEIIFTYD